MWLGVERIVEHDELYLTMRGIRKKSDSAFIALSCDNVAMLMMLHGCQGQWENLHNNSRAFYDA
jgi:hypothetical protein